MWASSELRSPFCLLCERNVFLRIRNRNLKSCEKLFTNYFAFTKNGKFRFTCVCEKERKSSIQTLYSKRQNGQRTSKFCGTLQEVCNQSVMKITNAERNKWQIAKDEQKISYRLSSKVQGRREILILRQFIKIHQAVELKWVHSFRVRYALVSCSRSCCYFYPLNVFVHNLNISN